MANASYEWYFGSRHKAFGLCEKALYSFVIGDVGKTRHELQQEIEVIMPYEDWKKHVLKLLISLPNPNLQLSDWVSKILLRTESVIQYGNNLTIRQGVNLSDKIKIKSRDKHNPTFKSIPLRNYINKKDESDITLSSVHGVKGETYDAAMLVIESKTGATLTPTVLETAPLDSELIRIAYVAMTRPRKLLVVAVPNVKRKISYSRFPQNKWIYIQI